MKSDHLAVLYWYYSSGFTGYRKLYILDIMILNYVGKRHCIEDKGVEHD